MPSFVKSFTIAYLRRLRQQSGFSLVEELVSLAVVSLGLVVLLGMISTGTKGVTTTVDRVTAEGLARSQLEQVKSDPYAATYAALAPASDYTLALAVEYWDPGTSTFVSTNTGSGLQRITVTLSRASSQILQLEDYKGNR
jgi:Tfp pilus assembly protein PilV